MRLIPIAVVALALLGTATLFAEEDDAPEVAPPLGLDDGLEATPDQAEAIAKGLAARPRRQVRVDATFLRVDATQADELLGVHRPDPLGSARPIPAALARRLIDLARGTGPVRPEPLPPLVLHDGQRGQLSSTGEHTYLQDYDVEVGGMGDSTVERMLGRLRDGAGLVIAVSGQDDRMRLAVDAAWAEVVRPVPVFSTTLASPHLPVTIELPEVRMFQLRKHVELPTAGGHVLAGGGRAWDGETLRLVVLEARPVTR